MHLLPTAPPWESTTPEHVRLNARRFATRKHSWLRKVHRVVPSRRVGAAPESTPRRPRRRTRPPPPRGMASSELHAPLLASSPPPPGTLGALRAERLVVAPRRRRISRDVVAPPPVTDASLGRARRRGPRDADYEPVHNAVARREARRRFAELIRGGQAAALLDRRRIRSDPQPRSDGAPSTGTRAPPSSRASCASSSASSSAPSPSPSTPR